jgi:mRNA-degrading endonuclease RelE of RelBE toxin-antitoxin system
MSERCELLFTKEFLRKIKKLDRQAQIRILNSVKTLEELPYSGKRLTGRLKGLLSFRQGEYRTIYQVKGNQVILRTVGHRKDVYEQ